MTSAQRERKNRIKQNRSALNDQAHCHDSPAIYLFFPISVKIQILIFD